MPEPTFVSMAQMQESKESESGDDDKVYLFFSETAVECDCYNKLVVSRVARVCKVIKGFTLHALPMTMEVHAPAALSVVSLLCVFFLLL